MSETPSGLAPNLLARGPWSLERVNASWLQAHFEPSAESAAAADAAIASLKARGSPSHDGVAGRLVSFSAVDGGLKLKLQPMRWSLRLVADDASGSIAAQCVTRSADGRWLAGKRAGWVASWAGRWTLGAGGAVDLGENPACTLVRELKEEWSVTPALVRAEALFELPRGLTMFVGQAWLAEAQEVSPDEEHDDYAWWPRDIDDWPPEASEPLRRLAKWLSC